MRGAGGPPRVPDVRQPALRGSRTTARIQRPRVAARAERAPGVLRSAANQKDNKLKRMHAEVFPIEILPEKKIQTILYKYSY